MSKKQTIKFNWSEIIERLRSDKQELAKFLRFSAEMYKQSFSDAALIYYQNPNATKVATLETWNKLGRLVNKGEHSIAVFGEDSRAKHLFDITQTNGKRIPELWKLTEDLSAELTAAINKKYDKGCKDIRETIAAMSVDNIRSHLSEMMYATGQMKLTDNDLKAYQQSVVSAVRFVVSNRCELGSDIKLSGGINLNAADFFKEKRDLVRFCTIVQKSAKDTLLEMEREIVQIIKKRREINELQIKPDRTVSSRSGVYGGQQRTENAPNADRSVGQNVAGVGENRVPDRGAGVRDGGSVADNSEGDRPVGGEPLSGTGRAVPSGKSPSADVRGNAVVGENAAADDRTSDYGGNNFSAEELIERYKNADFNRRLDSYEIAGRMLYEAEYNEFKGGAVAFFDRFEADKFSETQANEIRSIIKNALESREKSHDFIYVSVPEEPSQNEPVILNNEIVETSDLPPFINEKYIAEILTNDRFFKIKRDKVAEFFENTSDIEKRAEFMKKVFNADYTEIDFDDTRLGYKADKSGVLMWEGNFLSRTSEAVFSWDLVQSLTADLIEKGKYLDKKAVSQVYAEELQDGDKIRIEGEVWTVQNAGTYLISLKNDSGEHRNIYNAIDAKWYEVLDEIGFEFIPENELSEPVFAEPEAKEFPDPEPVPQVEQLSFFGDTEPAKKASQRPVAISRTAPNDEMIDYILKCGSNEPKSLERIVAQFQKEKSAAQNAEFLRKEFGEDGRGYKFTPHDFTHSALLAAWFDNSGITAAISNTAFPEGEKIYLSWEQVSEKISALLDKGEYCSQDIIDRAAEFEMTDIAGELWYIHQDLSNDYDKEYFIPKDFFAGGFPDSTEKIKISMTDENTLQKYIDGLSDFIGQYEENRNIMRYHFHNLKETLQRLNDLKIPRKEFSANADFKFEPKFFITEDEKDRLLTTGSGVEDGKFRIEKFFKAEHTAKEKADFLKNEYGTGGSGRSGFNTWHDAKGLKFTKDALSSNDCEVLMKWNEAAKRIDVLIAEDKYITQSEIDEYIRDAKRTVEQHKIGSEYDNAVVEHAKKILAEYGADIQKNTDISETKSPVEKIIERAEAAGIPVETVSEEKTVFMDIRDETFIAVQQVDEGVEYSVYASDLTVIDGGIWEMDEGMDLKSAAADLLATMEKNIVDVPDYDNFILLAEGNSDKDIPAELAKIKADIYSIIPSENHNVSAKKSEKNISDNNKNNSVSAVNSPEKITVPEIKEPKSGVPVTYHFSPENVAAGGAKSRFNSNIEAIKMLHKIEAENRFATSEEQAVMAKYVGWGGIQQAFVSDKVAENISGNLGEAAPSGWENEQKELLELLSPDEYKAARASTLTSFYTPPDVADGIYQALSQFGFEGGNVLEPSMGVGNFFAKMPEDMRDNSKLYGVELDSISGRIAQQLYPNERIQIKGFEQTNFNNNSFDIVIGNIPFGDYRVSDKKYDKYNFKIHDYFAAKAVDKVKPNGVVALVTSKFTIDGSFRKNADALEKVIPKNLEAGEISVRIGANWIDVEDYNRFLTEYAKAEMVLHPVIRTRMGEYKIEGKNRDYSVAASGTYGTSRMNSYCIFENLLNQRDIVVRDRHDEDGKVWYEVNAKETQLAKEKARQMKEGFKNWIWQDIDRREKYVEKYNNLFNAIRGREYDGSHQTFPGMNPAIKLRPHQENAILRGKLGGNTLLAHCVGAGKSFEIVATTMEKKRLGLIGKACVVVPKHLTLQMASEWIRLYPNAKLLVAHPEDFSKDNRQKFIARCVTGDYDAVIMSFTQFEKIPMSDEYRRQFLENELDEVMDALNETDDDDRVSVKTLERQKRKIEERLEKLTSSKKDNSLCFEKLGFDYLAVDEFHNYKNCFIATKMSNVAGVQTTAAQKSEDMLMKTQYLNDKYGCNNLLAATGTPKATPYQRFL